jgi:hypothetical protein
MTNTSALHGANTAAYPAQLSGNLDPAVSRWMWLFKWVLAIPHYVVLFFLFVAVFVTTIIAGFAILFTGRYPRGLFDFAVGVLRWNWRVSFYAYSALGTDKYPPFTLARTDYPADFDIAYPERLSRGLVLVKWWLLAIPHYLIVAIIAGGTWGWSRMNGDIEYANHDWSGATPGLLGLLVVIVALILLFTARYPQGLFNLVIGLNRWIFRVHSYAGLLTDTYPPFRLDQGPAEPIAADAAAIESPKA